MNIFFAIITKLCYKIVLHIVFEYPTDPQNNNNNPPVITGVNEGILPTYALIYNKRMTDFKKHIIT